MTETAIEMNGNANALLSSGIFCQYLWMCDSVCFIAIPSAHCAVSNQTRLAKRNVSDRLRRMKAV